MAWYDLHKRALPWRETTDPYKIWLSEIILQQTRVTQGLPYYQQFIEAYPTVEKLARASLQQVLRYWQGLGYYSRARNLHACAKLVSKKLNGRFPSTHEELLQLPGIGAYTAAAIASFAYREPVAAIDGNVFRVLARVFGLDADITSSAGKKLFAAKANELLDPGRPDLFNQAIMEFGAIQCKPKSPDCGQCVLRKSCVAFNNHWVEWLPVRRKKVKIKKRYFTYFVISKGKRLAMKVREGKDIWRGLYDFPMVESRKREKIETLLHKHTGLRMFATAKRVLYKARHVLTHQIIEAKFIALPPANATRHFKGQCVRFFSMQQIHRLPKPVLITRFLARKGILE